MNNKYAELMRNTVENIEIVCNYKGNGLVNWREILESQARRLSAAAAEMEQAMCKDCDGSGIQQYQSTDGVPAQDLCPTCEGMGYSHPAPVAPAVAEARYPDNAGWNDCRDYWLDNKHRLSASPEPEEHDADGGEMRRDAARYRYIRGSFGYGRHGISLPCGYVSDADREQMAAEADEAIDAAMKEEQ